MHRTIALIRCLIAVFLSVLAAAVRVPAQSSATPSPDTRLGSATHPDFSAEPAIYEFLHATMRYEDDGSGSREVCGRIRVQTSAGLSTAGQLVFEYNAVDEKVEIRSVRVLKPDGSVVAAGPDAVQDLNAPITSEAPMYTDARQKHVTVPGLSVGDAVEYDVFITSKPLLPGQFWQIWNFERRIVALDEQLDLNVPANRVLKIKSSQGIETSTHLEGDRRLYHYSTSNLNTPPPIDIFKDFKFDVIQLLQGPRPPPPPRVMFSTFQDWTSIADWYAQLERDRRIPTAEIRTQADEIARGRQSDEDKAAALYYWVSQNIRYVSLSFGVGRYQPHSAAEVLANRYGDCKDKTTLLEAMLEAEGLHAQPVLANLVADIDPEIPNPLQFDHVITLLPLGSKESWLDTTLGVGPFGYLPPQLRGKQVLLVYAVPSSALRKTPQDFPFTVEYRIGVDGTVDGLGTMDATVELQTRGDLEVLIRILNAHLSQEQLAKTADTVLARTNKFLYDSVRYTDFKVVNASDVSQPVRAQFHLAGRLMYVDPKGSTPAQVAVSLTSRPIDAWHLLTLLPAANSKPDSAGRPQQLPVAESPLPNNSFRCTTPTPYSSTLSGRRAPAPDISGRRLQHPHNFDAAAAEFQRAIQIDGSSHVLNSAAYALAQANTHLEIAASWSERAIRAEEVELDQAKLPLQAETLRRVSSLAAYWDTMGWIKLQQGNLETAEKYIRAAAELAADTTILYHLGRIYEVQGRKNEAIDTYAEALASVLATRPMDNDEKEARVRLGALLGDVSLVDDRVKLSRSKLRERRLVPIPNPTGLEGITQYSLILGRTSKVLDIEALNPDDPLAGLKDSMRSVTMLQSFPDETIQKLPRAGTLSCPRAELPCTFTFTPAGSASRVVSPD